MDLWESNWPALELFSRVSTQWRMGPGGPIGLDYGVVLHEIDRTGLSGDEYDELMAAVRIIEAAALDQIYK